MAADVQPPEAIDWLPGSAPELSEREAMLVSEADAQGYAHGFERGYRRGYDEGWRACYEQMSQVTTRLYDARFRGAVLAVADLLRTPPDEGAHD